MSPYSLFLVALIFLTLHSPGYSCPRKCVSKRAAERQCAQTRFIVGCTVVPCGGPTQGRATCISRRSAKAVCPNKCTTRKAARSVCGQARWIELCSVSRCGGNKFKCAQKKKTPAKPPSAKPSFRFLACRLCDDETLPCPQDTPFGKSTALLFLDSKGSFHFPGLAALFSPTSVPSENELRCALHNPLLAASSKMFYNKLVAEGCTLNKAASSVTVKPNGMCSGSINKAEKQRLSACMERVARKYKKSADAFLCGITGDNVDADCPAGIPTVCRNRDIQIDFFFPGFRR